MGGCMRLVKVILSSVLMVICLGGLCPVYIKYGLGDSSVWQPLAQKVLLQCDAHKDIHKMKMLKSSSWSDMVFLLFLGLYSSSVTALVLATLDVLMIFLQVAEHIRVHLITSIPLVKDKK